MEDEWFELRYNKSIFILGKRESDEHLFQEEYTKLGGKPENHLYAAIPRFYSKVSM